MHISFKYVVFWLTLYKFILVTSLTGNEAIVLMLTMLPSNKYLFMALMRRVWINNNNVSSIGSTTSLVKFILAIHPLNWTFILILLVRLKILIEHTYLKILLLVLTTSYHSLTVFSNVLSYVPRKLIFQDGCLFYHLRRINLTYQQNNLGRDALTLNYRRPLLNLPGTCDGYGATFTVDHALDCGFGGLVINRHNEVWGAVGDLASLLWNPVRHEPIVKEAGDDEQGSLVADLAICGVWQPRC